MGGGQSVTLQMWYRFDETDSNLGTDNKGTLNMTNMGVTSIPETYGHETLSGNAAFFDGSSYMYLPQNQIPSYMVNSSSRTYSCWLKPTESGVIHTNGDISAANELYRAFYNSSGSIDLNFNTSDNIGATCPIPGTWFHYVSTYKSTNSLSEVYINGVELLSSAKSLVTGLTGNFEIGRDTNEISLPGFHGSISDFRVYNGVLGDYTITVLNNSGPLGIFTPSITVTMYTHIADISWKIILGASLYTITQTKDGGIEEIIAETSELSWTQDIVPGATYVYNLYTDLNPLSARASTTSESPVMSSTSMRDIISRVGNDLTQVNREVLSALDDFQDMFSTGDDIKLKVNGINTETSFVENSDTIHLKKGYNIFTPFYESEGTGQNCTVTTDEGDSMSLTYDDSSNEVIFDSIHYSPGTYFNTGSYKVQVKEL